jgi:predicted Fe-Mo cluster-binding NifX family protein
VKVAVSATGPGAEAALDPHLGRCAYFVVYDDETDTFSAVANPGAAEGGGAGIKAAQSLLRQGVNAVISGSVGPNAYQILEQAGIRCYLGKSGPVRESVQAWRENALRPLKSAGGPGWRRRM